MKQQALFEQNICTKYITTALEKLFTLCYQLEAQITSNQNDVEQLMQAVFKEVFQQSLTNLSVIRTPYETL